MLTFKVLAQMKSHLFQFTIAFFICVLLVNAIFYYKKSVLENEDISKWYEVAQLAVADYVVGEDEIGMIYDRVVYRDFVSETSIRVQTLIDKSLITECVRNIKETYKVSNIRIERSLLLKDFVGAECKPDVPGTYRISLLMDIDRGQGLAPIKVILNSEIFEVKAPSAE